MVAIDDLLVAACWIDEGLFFFLVVVVAVVRSPAIGTIWPRSLVGKDLFFLVVDVVLIDAITSIDGPSSAQSAYAINNVVVDQRRRWLQLSLLASLGRADIAAIPS